MSNHEFISRINNGEEFVLRKNDSSNVYELTFNENEKYEVDEQTAKYIIDMEIEREEN